MSKPDYFMVSVYNGHGAKKTNVRYVKIKGRVLTLVESKCKASKFDDQGLADIISDVLWERAVRDRYNRVQDWDIRETIRVKARERGRRDIAE